MSRGSTRRPGSSTTCGLTRRSATTSRAEQPERLAAMVEQWWAEAERNNVLPIDNRPFSDMVFGRPPSVAAARPVHRTGPGRAPVPESVAVNVRGRAHSITAHVTVPDGLDVVEGVLAVQGSVLGGWSFHLLGDGRLVYVHNLAGWRHVPGGGPRVTRRSARAWRPHPRHALRPAQRGAAGRRRDRGHAARSDARCGAASRSPAPDSPLAGRRTSLRPTRTTAVASSSPARSTASRSTCRARQWSTRRSKPRRPSRGSSRTRVSQGCGALSGQVCAHDVLDHVDQPPGQCGGRVDRLTGEAEPGRAVPADASREAHRSTGAGDEAERHLGERERGVEGRRPRGRRRPAARCRTRRRLRGGGRSPDRPPRRSLGPRSAAGARGGRSPDRRTTRTRRGRRRRRTPVPRPPGAPR